MIRKISLITFISTFPFLIIRAQNPSSMSFQPMNGGQGGISSGSQKFLLTGSASANFTYTNDGNTFAPMSMMLMPLVKITDRLFVINGLKFENADGSLDLGLESLDMYYKVSPALSIHMGKFPAPWGNVLDMFGEGFVSRFATSPIGLSDDGMAPTDQVGIGILGGLQTGRSKILYNFYLSNGPQLVVDSGASDGNMSGHMSYENWMDNNKNKAIGGKIGWLPFSNSGLQLDAFGQVASQTGDAGSLFENVSSTSYGADLNLYQNINPVRVRLMAQYESTQTSNAMYSAMQDTSTFIYTYNNNGNSWYAATTIRPVGLENKFLSNIEIGGRYVTYTPPQNALWGGKPQTHTTLMLTYWFTWASQINFGYDIISQQGSPTMNSFNVRTLFKF